jgi:hypothetical protein
MLQHGESNAVVHSKGNTASAWSTLQRWLQPVITLLLKLREDGSSSSSSSAHWQQQYASYGSSTSRDQWEHAQGNAT